MRVGVIEESERLESRLRRVYGAFAAGDVAPMAEFLADDVVYHLPGKHLGGGTLRGRGALLRRMAQAAAECDAPPLITVIQIVASGDMAISLEHFLARRRGRTLDQDVWVSWRLAGDRCVEISSHFTDQQACDRFWETP